MRGEELRERVQGESGFVGIASTLVQYDAQYDGIFKNLLGRTVVVEDLDCGIAMARKFGARFRIVTLDGQVMNRGGSMTGGSVSRSAGILSRANELERLRAQLGGLKERLLEAARVQEACERELTASQYELEVAESQKRQAEDAVLKLETEQGHYRVLLESIAANLENLAGELTALDGRREENQAACAQAEKDIAALEAEAAQLRESARERLSGQSDLQAQAGALTEQVSARKEETARLTAERDTTVHALEELEQLRAGMMSDRSEREARRQQCAREAEGLRGQIAEKEREIGELKTQGAALRARLEDLSRKKLELEAERTAKNRESREKNDAVLQLERETARLEQKRPPPPWRKSRSWTACGTATSCLMRTPGPRAWNWRACPRRTAASESCAGRSAASARRTSAPSRNLTGSIPL